MELEVYNEYAIIQHYSDLTDYISENIYMLDKDEQSEIITENWGLVAVGALLLGGLIWLIIHLVTNAKNNKAKEAKVNKDAENAEKIKDAAEKAVEQSGASKEDIGDLTNLIKCCMICPSIVQGGITTKDSADSSANAIRGKSILWSVEYIHIIKRGSKVEQNEALRLKVEDLRKAKKELSNSGYGIVKEWAEQISVDDFQKEIENEIDKNNGSDIKIYVDKKLRGIAHRIFNEDHSFSDEMEKSKKGVEDQKNKEARGIHHGNKPPTSDSLVNADQEIQKYFRNISAGANPTSKEFIKIADMTDDAQKSFCELLGKINTSSDDLTKSFPKVNSNNINEDKEVDNIIDLISEATKGSTITTILSQYGSLMTDLINKMDSLTRRMNVGLAQEAELSKDTIIGIVNVYLNSILESIFSWYTSKPYIITEMYIYDKAGKTKLDNNISGMNAKKFKTEMEKKFKEWEQNSASSYKKSLNESIKKLMDEVLFIQTVYNALDEWLGKIAKNYLIVLMAANAYKNSNWKVNDDKTDIRDSSSGKSIKISDAISELKSSTSARQSTNKHNAV